MIALIVAIALGFLCFIFVANIYQVRFPSEPEIQRRLENIKKSIQTSEAIIMPEFDTLNQDFKFRLLAKYLKNFKLVEYIKTELSKAGVDIQVDSFIIISAFCCAPLLILSVFLTPVLIPMAFLCGLIPFGVLKYLIAKRAKLFTQQFPDALDLLSNSLRAGHSLYSGFEVIVNEMPKPLSQVFKNTVDEIAFGIDTKDAILSLNRMMPSSMDLKFFTTAVLLQREVGGNLAKILDNLSKTIRERFKILGQLKAQTSQARFSGVILTLVPPIIAVVLFILSPDYMEPLLSTKDGNAALAIAFCLLVTGILCINKIISIEI